MRSAAMRNSTSRWQPEHEQDRRLLAALDAHTEIPHLLVELRSLGYIEICGKDMGGIYQRLEDWMGKQWGCEFLSTEVRVVADRDSDFGLSGPYFTGMVNRVGPMAEWNRLCDASFDWPPNELVCRCMPMCGKNIVTVFKLRGNEGENNMGKLTMELVNFMTQTCGWGLHLCNGTNLGFHGQIREQQVIFKAPHPLNLTASHLMTLRSPMQNV